jgi:hypothetical protein
MRMSDIEFRCYETYYYANAIRNILSDQFAYLRHLHDFYGDGRQVRYTCPYPRFSAFHSFVSFVVDELVFAEDEIDLSTRQDAARRLSSMPPRFQAEQHILPIERALTYYGLNHESFSNWLDEQAISFDEATDGDVCEYHDELRREGPVEELLEQVVEEVFFVLFSNRRVLLLFNEMMARQLSNTDLDEVPDEYLRHFARKGVLRRVATPEWVKRVVFFRDRGRCVACRRDLSGILSSLAEEEFDHIVPLANGGLNDVTNIQLLCKECNRRKRDGHADTSDFYEVWYQMEE